MTTSQEETKNRPRRAALKACAVAAIFAALCSSLLGLGISSAGAGGSTASFTILYTNNDGGPCRPPNPDFCNPVYSVIDEQIVLVAFVGTNAAGPAKPTGTVTFRDAGTVLSAVVLNSSNVAVYFAVFAPGPHVFTASYAGDGTFGPSSGDGAVPAQVTQTVQDNCAIVTGEVASPGPTVFQDGRWYQKSGYGGGRVGNCFNWGAPGQIPVLGDWDGDGKQTIGVYAAGRWYLRNSSKSGPIEIIFDWGSPGMIPVVGDWDGDGKDSIGLYSNGTWYLRNSNTSGPVDIQFTWGSPGMIPVVGDWNNDAIDTPGLFSGGTWYLSNRNGINGVDSLFAWGAPTDQPISGNWDYTGGDTVGVFRSGQWLLRNVNASGPVDVSFAWGGPGQIATPGQ